MFSTVSIIANSEASIETLVQLLFEPPNYSIVSIDKCGRTGVESVKKHQPDVVILDFQLKDITGLEVAKRVKAYLPTGRVFALLDFSELAILERLANEKNIDAIAMKNSVYFKENFRRALDQVMAGESYLDPALFDTFRSAQSRGLEALTKREFEVFIQMYSGKSEHTIAEDLNVELASVKNIKSRVNKKVKRADISSLLAKLMKNATDFDAVSEDLA